MINMMIIIKTTAQLILCFFCIPWSWWRSMFPAYTLSELPEYWGRHKNDKYDDNNQNNRSSNPVFLLQSLDHDEEQCPATTLSELPEYWCRHKNDKSDDNNQNNRSAKFLCFFCSSWAPLHKTIVSLQLVVSLQTMVTTIATLLHSQSKSRNQWYLP